MTPDTRTPELERLFQGYPDPFVFYDGEGRVRFLNRAFERVYGWTLDDLRGRRIDFVPPEERDITQASIREALETGEAQIQTRRRTKAGEILDVEIRAVCVRDEAGSLVGTYVIHRDRSEEVRRRRELAESEARYRILLDASPDPISVYSAEGTVVYVNPAFTATFGWTLEELSGRGIDFVPPEEAARTRDAVARTLAGESVLLDTRRLTKDGRLLDIQLRTAAIHDADGRLLGDIVIYRDLTAKRQALAELRETRARYRLLLDASPDPICVYTADGRVVYVNPAFTATFGWTLGEIEGRELDFVPPGERKRTDEAIGRLLRGEPVSLETRRLTKDRRVLEISLHAAPVRDEDGNLSGDIVIYRDVTEQRRRDAELERYRTRLEEMVRERTRALEEANARLSREIGVRRRAEAAVRESEARYRALFAATPDAILVAEAEGGTVLEANPAACRLLGRTEGALRGAPLEAFWADDAGLRFSDRLRTGEAAGATAELRVRRADGSPVVVEASGRRLVLGNRPSVLVLLHDLTEQRRLAEQLRHAQRLEAVGTLAGGIAHEFRNLLQIVRGQQDLLAERLRGDPDALRRLGRIAEACDRGARLTGQLLTFSRKVESRLEPVDLNREVRQVAEMLRGTLPRMVRIDLDLADGLPTVRADAAQVEQVLVNLALNARDAMPAGGTLTLATAPARPEDLHAHAAAGDDPSGWVALRVRDTGIGMDATTLERIFDPFFTTKTVGAGTGLGLATVYGIVQNHGGHITCRSRPGEGTEFTLLLPRAGEAEPAGAEAPGPAEPERPLSACGTLLVVDDEETIREMLAEYLGGLGWEVIQAGTGEQALERCRPDVDAVVLDLGMPGMGGEACLEELQRRVPGLPVVVVSGYAEAERARRLAEKGARAYLPKPYRLTEVVAVLERLVGARPPERP
ncbi:MAG: PAS domain S-box protein [Candidatus Dadabacteria bacterium]|nr:MAG: PAS domain S-box protein [Candidatus Dadabacteria bacterium]